VSRPFVFLAWTHVGGRSAEIAADLGGEAHNIWFPSLASGWRVPIRYVASAFATVALLLRVRPRAVMVTNPPIFPAMIAWLWCTLTRGRLVLDSHPASFGLKDNRVAEAFLPAHRFLARKAAGVAVTTETLGDEVRAWGGDPLIVHEAPPPPVTAASPVAADDRTSVLFVCTFAPDEPWREVLAAAPAMGPDVRLLVTGRPEKIPAADRRGIADNVELVGFVDPDAYLALLADSDVVVSLTTEPDSIMRSAYEAVYLERPLIVTDTEALREVFPRACFVDNTAEAIAAGVRTVVDERVQYCREAAAAKDAQRERWADQRRSLIERLALQGP